MSKKAKKITKKNYDEMRVEIEPLRSSGVYDRDDERYEANLKDWAKDIQDLINEHIGVSAYVYVIVPTYGACSECGNEWETETENPLATFPEPIGKKWCVHCGAEV